MKMKKPITAKKLSVSPINIRSPSVAQYAHEIGRIKSTYSHLNSTASTAHNPRSESNSKFLASLSHAPNKSSIAPFGSNALNSGGNASTFSGSPVIAQRFAPSAL